MTDIPEHDPAEAQLSSDLATIIDILPEVMDEERPMSEVEAFASQAVYDAIQNASNGTARSQQAQDFRIGVSTLGHCKQFAKLMMTETPFSDERDKTPAFFGTVSGDAIEKQLRIDHPDWLIQESTVFHIPSGGEVGGHYDVVVPSWAATEEHPQGVRDLKSKSELETIKKMGQSRQQIYQLHAYAKGCIDEGLFDLSKPIYVMNVFYDRSGNTREPYTIATLYRDDVVGFIDEWINDVKYAVLNGEDAEREMPRSWCASWCEYATVCRGADTDVEGLIEDPELVVAITSYAEAAKTVTAAEKVKKALKPILTGHSGSTGKHNMRWIEIGESEVAFTRKAYMKLDIRPVSVPKPPKAKKKEEGES